MGGFSAVPKPLVFCSSTTTEPEKMSSIATPFSSNVCGMASGCSSQCTRSVLVAWPQLMLPQRVPCGLCWKNRCHVPSSYTRPLGSFIQLRSGEKCRYGRYCSSAGEAAVAAPVSSALAGMAPSMPAASAATATAAAVVRHRDFVVIVCFALHCASHEPS